MNSDHSSNVADRRAMVVIAWVVILLISDLPDIFWKMVFSQIPGWLFWAKIGVLGLFLGLCHLWKRIQPLTPFALVMLVFYLAFRASVWLGNISWWRNRFAGEEPTFTLGYLGIYIRDLGIALAVIVTLLILKRRLKGLFLNKGLLGAPVEPVPWLGIRPGETWKKFGIIIALIAGVGILVPTLLSIKPSAGLLLKTLPLLPSVLLFAAVNAFTEEVYYRVSLLSTLHQVIGKTHTLLVSSVFFGLAHYLYGSPPGVLGFLLTAILAWFLGKAMLETRGLFWPWLIHFVPDVVIFASYAILWVRG